MAQKSCYENGWQDLKPTVHARRSHLLQNNFMSDFTFVSDDVKFPVHKFVLASASSVFYPMFYGPMAEQKQELDLSFFGNAECISEFLKFVYTDEISLNWNNVFPLLNLAKCYLISSLENICSVFIEESVTKENVLLALQQSRLFGAKAAVSRCLDIISRKASEIMEQESFLALNLAGIKAILELDTVKIKEVDLFLAVDRWCENQLINNGKKVSPELKRELLGDAVFLIRFPTMSLTDFAKHCSQSGMLTPAQVADIVHYLSLGEEELQKSVRVSIDFCTKPRNNTGKEILADRIRYSPPISCWRYLGKPDELAFTVNKRAFFTGITLFGDPNVHRIVEMKIVTNGWTFKPKYTFEGRNSGPLSGTYRVDFEKPIEVLGNQRVIVSLVIAGPDSIGFNCDAKKMFETDGFQCRFSSAKIMSVGTTVSRGQFPALIFEVP
eukprot:Seg11421.1 transcript_id=Seg11421.1/GoldUCD/mRNA.D3Y31 product="BTB/POZ domain-containing protein 2" protein_id=Seg11421.1/GoldUCD/D3Y31